MQQSTGGEREGCKNEKQMSTIQFQKKIHNEINNNKSDSRIIIIHYNNNNILDWKQG